MQTPARIPIGVSACLAGQEVRFNGGHQRARWLLDVLGEYCSFRPVCPEVGVGMGVPREPLRLVGDDASRPALVTRDGGRDVTDAVAAIADDGLEQFRQLCGFVVAKGSPSCGLERVKRYRADGNLIGKDGMGVFTRRLGELLPWLPVEEQGRLHDPGLRENFVGRIFALADFRASVGAGGRPATLVDFHARYKFMLLAHDPVACRELGQLVADAGSGDIAAVVERYLGRFMGALARPATRRNHTNALMHLQGFLKRRLDTAAKRELAGLIQAYRRCEVPLIAPMTLLHHHFRCHTEAYIERQAYLRPYPAALGLRNAI